MIAQPILEVLNDGTKAREMLAKALVELPKYALYYMGGFIVAILTDVSVTTLALFSIVLGFILSWLIGLGTFLGVYLVLRQWDTMNGAIATGCNAVASQINQHASVVNAWRQAQISHDQEHN